MFSIEFRKILNKTVLTEYLQAIASDLLNKIIAHTSFFYKFHLATIIQKRCKSSIF